MKTINKVCLWHVLASVAVAQPVILAVENAASYEVVANSDPYAMTTSAAPGSLVQIYTSLPGATQAIASQAPFPLTLGNVRVTFNGVPAPISAVLPDLPNPVVNVQIPFETSTILNYKPVLFNTPLPPPTPCVPSSSVSCLEYMVVTINGAPSAPLLVTIDPVAPGIFTTGVLEPSDNYLCTFFGTYGCAQAIAIDLSTNALITPSNPIARGGLAFFYTTGLGALSPAVADGMGSPSGTSSSLPIVDLNDVFTSIPVLYAGQAPGFPGVNQINIRIPESAPTGPNVILIVQDAYPGPFMATISIK